MWCGVVARVTQLILTVSTVRGFDGLPGSVPSPPWNSLVGHTQCLRRPKPRKYGTPHYYLVHLASIRLCSRGPDKAGAFPPSFVSP